MKIGRTEIIDRISNHYLSKEFILLESQLEGHPSSGQSFIAVQPRREIYGFDREIIQKESGKETAAEGDPWKAVKSFYEASNTTIFGYLGYDLKNHIEPLSTENPALLDVPDFYFMEPEILFRIADGQVDLLQGDADIDVILSSEGKNPDGSVENIHPLEEKEHYLSSVREIQRRIREGDFYELNYSYPFEGQIEGNPMGIYRKMRDVNPVPFGGFIQTDSFSVCSASPERFLKKTGRKILSEPIKGTVPTSENQEEDRRLKEILLNEKNKAENLMIVDLVRHDLSLIAETGSVKVSKLFDIQTFGTVHQLISSVEATALSGISPVDIIKSCFPMGSMTGAPKIEVMKSIDELEMYKRGIYSGAIGYITPDGDFDFNVVIRSAIIQNKKLIYPVGGAITGDSEPDEEWHETEVKARAITRAAKKY